MEKGNLILNTKKFNIQYLCEYLQQLLFIKNYKNCDFEDKKKKKKIGMNLLIIILRCHLER